MTIASAALNIVVVLLVLLLCVGVPLLCDFKRCRDAIAKLLGPSGLFDYAYESVNEHDDDDLAFDEEEAAANLLLRNELVRRPADPPSTAHLLQRRAGHCWRFPSAPAPAQSPVPHHRRPLLTTLSHVTATPRPTLRRHAAEGLYEGARDFRPRRHASARTLAQPTSSRRRRVVGVGVGVGVGGSRGGTRASRWACSFGRTHVRERATMRRRRTPLALRRNSCVQTQGRRGVRDMASGWRRWPLLAAAVVLLVAAANPAAAPATRTAAIDHGADGWTAVATADESDTAATLLARGQELLLSRGPGGAREASLLFDAALALPAPSAAARIELLEEATFVRQLAKQYGRALAARSEAWALTLEQSAGRTSLPALVRAYQEMAALQRLDGRHIAALGTVKEAQVRRPTHSTHPLPTPLTPHTRHPARALRPSYQVRPTHRHVPLPNPTLTAARSFALPTRAWAGPPRSAHAHDRRCSEQPALSGVLGPRVLGQFRISVRGRGRRNRADRGGGANGGANGRANGRANGGGNGGGNGGASRRRRRWRPCK